MALTEGDYLMRGLPKLWKSAIVGSGLLISLACISLAVYIFIDYRIHTHRYFSIQSLELDSIKQKTIAVQDNLKKLLLLMSESIREAKGDVELMQSVVSSKYLLQELEPLPLLQSVSYLKCSVPKMTITRFGTLPYDNGKFLTAEASVKKAPSEMSLIFSDKAIFARMLVIDHKGLKDGIIEVQVNPLRLKAFLGSYDTVEIAIGTALGQFHFHNKPPQRFAPYAWAHLFHYTVFNVYTLLVGSFIWLLAYFTQRTYAKRYGKHIATLEEALKQAKNQKKALNEALQHHEEARQVSELSLSHQGTLKGRLFQRHKEQINYIVRSLEVLKAFIGHNLNLNEEDVMVVLKTCTQQAKTLAKGLYVPTKKMAIDISMLLENTQNIFAEKIYCSSLNIEIKCPQPLIFMGDPAFTELILVNVIGRAVFRTPSNGTVIITAYPEKEAAYVETTDNGYPLRESAEKFIQKSFELFISERIFQEICTDNSFLYENLTTDDGFNVTKLMLVPASEDASSGKIIRLFK